MARRGAQLLDPRVDRLDPTLLYIVPRFTFTPLGDGFVSQPGMWVGAQVGLFAQAPSGTPAFVSTRIGYASFGDFRILP